MHYFYLSQLGEHYDGEEGTAGVRQVALDALAAKLRTAMVDLEATKVALNPPPKTGSVKDKAKFFQDVADPNKQNELKQKVREAEQKVKNLKEWLTRQDVVVDNTGNIEWGPSARTVAYDSTLVAQGLTKVRFANGLLYTDDACTIPFDTRSTVTHFSGPGYAIYVMGATGNLHVSSHSVGYRHHSSLLAGQNVAGAGELQIDKGKLKQISNKSGHYAPAAAHFLQTLHQLQKKHVDLTNVKVTFNTATGKTPYPTVAAYLAAMQAQGIDDFEYAKLVRYLVLIPYPEFEVLAAGQGWRWVNVGEINAGQRGLVTIAGGAPVPHKQVRKWLKSIGKGAHSELQSGIGR